MFNCMLLILRGCWKVNLIINIYKDTVQQTGCPSVAVFVHPENICNFTPEMYTKRSLIKIYRIGKNQNTQNYKTIHERFPTIHTTIWMNISGRQRWIPAFFCRFVFKECCAAQLVFRWQLRTWTNSQSYLGNICFPAIFSLSFNGEESVFSCQRLEVPSFSW